MGGYNAFELIHALTSANPSPGMYCKHIADSNIEWLLNIIDTEKKIASLQVPLIMKLSGVHAGSDIGVGVCWMKKK